MKKQSRRFRWSWAAVGLVLGLLVYGMIQLGAVMHMQLQWKQFELQFAASVGCTAAEGGYLRAQSETEDVRVDPRNGQNVFKMIQTARCTGLQRVREPVEQIRLTFGDGAVGLLSLDRQERVHIAYTSSGGQRWQFYLGTCSFSSLRKLLSVEGAAVENMPWT